MSGLQVSKVLNNNVIIAHHPQHDEVVVIGKGIGFNRKAGDEMPLSSVEKMFILTNEQEQEQYKQLVPHVEEELIEVINEGILYVKEHSELPVNEHIQIALTDHIAFAMRRQEQGLVIQNPFLYETREMYPEEFRMGEYMLELIHKKLGVELEPDEAGFIALHIHSALTNQHITQVKGNSHLIADLVSLVETSIAYHVPRNSLDYSRLVTHLRFAIERIRRGESVQENASLEKLLKQEYPQIYALACELIILMEERLKESVYAAEACYLTLHLQRLVQKKEQDD
ncbi:glucose PTS transporter transcription antiterminator GlcT [Paenibacillus pini]|uniref:Transcription antiterminator GlcT n=1 Tax=Paenibacillus pini JCM 16418 TaxID=1236976 RepID=W7YGY9_9BACL|nr:PRD domain-containing protein [Paenibacillus pini]GAF06868.1 transcription antiterminator GlcT [Paenibacillus pini JCM 16418]